MNKLHIYIFRNEKYPDESVIGQTSSLKEFLSQLNAGGGTWQAISQYEVFEPRAINDFNYVFRMMGKANKKKYLADSFGVDLNGDTTNQVISKIADATHTGGRFCLLDENGEPLCEEFVGKLNYIEPASYFNAEMLAALEEDEI